VKDYEAAVSFDRVAYEEEEILTRLDSVREHYVSVGPSRTRANWHGSFSTAIKSQLDLKRRVS
jgi:hypothetical protein